MKRLLTGGLMGIGLVNGVTAATQALPDGFVYLKTVDPTIQQSVRYATKDNFFGRPIVGYRPGAEVVLTRQAAEALKQVQMRAKRDGYCLVIYDGYRPQDAVNDFMAWEFSSDQSMKQAYYPAMTVENIFKKRYVDKKSRHSGGSTLDVTLITLGKKVKKIVSSKRILTDGRTVLFLDDGTVDMGTSFDLFDEASRNCSQLVSKEARERRKYLKDIMVAGGFKAFSGEWWHFNLLNDPYPTTFFNFAF